MTSRKVLVIGLDCATPELLFGDFLPELPNIRKFIKNGIYGRLESCHPPITCPAWAVMVTSKNPGTLGFYGFRHRRNYSYKDIGIVSSAVVKEPTVWDILGRNGKKVCLVGIPPAYPPKPVNGCLVSGFLTPDTNRKYTYPASLKEELETVVGKYIPDVDNFRTDEKERLLREIYELSENRFAVVKYLMETKEWDFFMFVEMGPDRIHHGFWKFFDKSHFKYEPGSPYEEATKDYYKYLDKQIGELLTLAGKETTVFIVSDHGAKRMKGCVCINEWLIKEGYLTLKEAPTGIIPLEKAKVDWGKTKAWGWGGYYARIFLNVVGREATGSVKPEEYNAVRDELAAKLARLRDPNGNQMNNVILKPEELYPECKGDYPDLMVYFDDLSWRSAGTIGHNSIYLSENDTGPDDAVHSHYGIFVMYDPQKRAGSQMRDLSIYDVAPTILSCMGIPVLEDMEGTPIGDIE